jgi:UDP-N-acetylmuramoyl-L-alanyl-D-glutamate--2,6-diaminopimelate ligase
MGTPARELLTLGVTGTNGKTTTTYLLDAALRALGRVTGMIGTVETRIADTAFASVRTTPEAPDLHGLLAVMVERAATVCSMEVSSQALAQHRVDGVVFDVAGFTSFSQDHLELHGDMATYLAAKALLFTPEHSRHGVVVVDDDGGRAIAERSSVPVTTVSGRRDAGADWTVVERSPAAATTAFVLQHRDGRRLALRCPLPGDFNVLNTALAAVLLLTAGQREDDVVTGLSRAGGVPGRMETVSAGSASGPLAVVDYAHTPRAVGGGAAGVARQLGRWSARRRPGCRRRPRPGKRHGMGAAAAANADVVVVTDDNPRSEPPADIRAAVLAGAREAARASGAQVVEVADRAAAIRHGVELAGPATCCSSLARGTSRVRRSPAWCCRSTIASTSRRLWPSAAASRREGRAGDRAPARRGGCSSRRLGRGRLRCGCRIGRRLARGVRRGGHRRAARRAGQPLRRPPGRAR